MRIFENFVFEITDYAAGPCVLYEKSRFVKIIEEEMTIRRWFSIENDGTFIEK